MTYTKPMIDLMREIRRRVPADDKPSIKLANPDVLSELITIYRATSDNILRALVRDLMAMAGGDWSTRLEVDVTPPVENKERFITRVYRGQTTLVEAMGGSGESEERRQERRKRVYRGQVIA